MITIDNITYDNDYSHATTRFLLLNDQTLNQTGPSPVIEIPNATLMTFIHVFRDLFQCQAYVRNDNQKLITLVIANKNIIDWDTNIGVTDHNINEIYIFCDTCLSYITMRNWNRCYRNRIRDVYLPDELDFKLLQLGANHVYKIIKDFRETRGLRDKFRADGQRLSQAMANYFQNKIDNEDDDDV
jgi:hypothetical protein